MKKLLCFVLLTGSLTMYGRCCNSNSGCCGSNSNCCKPVVKPKTGCCGPNSSCCKPVVCPPKQSATNKQVVAQNQLGNSQFAEQQRNQDAQKIKETVKETYGKIAQTGDSSTIIGVGGDDIAHYLGYSKEELDKLADANLGLGCGNIVKLGEFQEGDVVLDLGSGAGLDSFLAAKKVGDSGMVIGVDMTSEMIKKAWANARKYDIENVEFRLGDIENLPVASDSVDVIISNCVINLAPDKDQVFKEAYRVLKKDGRMYVTDTVLLGELSSQQKTDLKLLCACVAGALPREVYLQKLKDAGFEITILDENKEISKEWFGKELPIASICYRATK